MSASLLSRAAPALQRSRPHGGQTSVPSEVARSRHSAPSWLSSPSTCRVGAGVSRRRRAMTVLSCLVGALMLSRAVHDPETSDELLAAARRHLTAPAS